MTAVLAIVADCSDLAVCEKIIADGLRTYIEVGCALMRIRDEELFRGAGFDTFDAYAREKWEFGKARASQLISASKLAERVNNCKLPSPANEGQARQLRHVDEEEQARVWAEVIRTAPGGVVTAKHIASVVAAFCPADEPDPFHPLVALAGLKDSLVAKIRGTVEGWPARARGNVPGMLRALADDLEKEFSC